MRKNIDGSIIEMTCRQLGAKKISKFDGTLYFFEFDITEDYSLLYTFNINDKNEYCLRRIKPYPFFHGAVDNEDEVIGFIKKDLRRFQNARKSSNFVAFVTAINRLHTLGEEMDDLFLNFNIDKEALADVNKELDDINDHIREVKSISTEINLTAETENK